MNATRTVASIYGQLIAAEVSDNNAYALNMHLSKAQ
jgi:hypothetical protein